MHTDMTRVNAIWQHPLYQQNLKDLIHLEADRIFCRHTPEHFLDVARLAYIFALERGLNCSRELIYCTALLHDIGRVRQYMDGTHMTKPVYRSPNRFYLTLLFFY